MSRSRALNRIHRIVRQQIAETHGDRSVLSRRHVLKLGAMALAALALPKLSRSTSRTPRIGIVGAGISGLTAALTLQDNGLASTRPPIASAGACIPTPAFGNRAR
jgi:heterodisulfide reductase subunit A-like polyferredoxin